MPRICFTKSGSAVWISHLDLMRVLQRAFRRAEIPLRHSQGFSPHPSLSIALPLSVGVASQCELADFDLDESAEIVLAEIPHRLNAAMPQGIEVLDCYDDGQKLKHLQWLEAELTLIYDRGVPTGAASEIEALLRSSPLSVEKHGKNGPVTVDIAPMLKRLSVEERNEKLVLDALVSAQNPTLNPLLLGTAIQNRLPSLYPELLRCCRIALYDESLQRFH